ncbi:MAG: hypothetical protein HC820_10055 [Hydrococcus sp. RM1_1_31]|nr:hypothetical protein [Hydrococcus sp. RM1_1_31]
MTSQQLLLKYASKYPFLIFLTFSFSFASALFSGISTALIVPLLLGGLSGDLLNLGKHQTSLKS